MYQSHAITLSVAEFQRVHQAISQVGANHQTVQKDLALLQLFEGMDLVLGELSHRWRLGFLGKDEATKALL